MGRCGASGGGGGDDTFYTLGAQHMITEMWPADMPLSLPHLKAFSYVEMILVCKVEFLM